MWFYRWGNTNIIFLCHPRNKLTIRLPVIDTDGADAAPSQETEVSATNNKAALIWLIAFAGIAAAVTIGIVIVKKRKEEN